MKPSTANNSTDVGSSSTATINELLERMASDQDTVTFTQRRLPGSPEWHLFATAKASGESGATKHYAVSQHLAKANLDKLSVPEKLYSKVGQELKNDGADYDADLMQRFASFRRKDKSLDKVDPLQDKSAIQVMALNQWAYEPPSRFDKKDRQRKKPFFNYQQVNGLYRSNKQFPAGSLENVFLSAVVVTDAINAFSRTSKEERYQFTTRHDDKSWAPDEHQGSYSTRGPASVSNGLGDKKSSAFTGQKKKTIFIDPEGVAIAAFSPFPHEEERLTPPNKTYIPMTLAKAEKALGQSLRSQLRGGRISANEVVWVDAARIKQGRNSKPYESWKTYLTGEKNEDKSRSKADAAMIVAHSNSKIEVATTVIEADKKIQNAWSELIGHMSKFGSNGGESHGNSSKKWGKYLPQQGAQDGQVRAQRGSVEETPNWYVVTAFKAGYDLPHWQYFRAFLPEEASHPTDEQLLEAVSLGLLAMPDSVTEQEQNALGNIICLPGSAVKSDQAIQVLNSGYANNIPKDILLKLAQTALKGSSKSKLNCSALTTLSTIDVDGSLKDSLKMEVGRLLKNREVPLSEASSQSYVKDVFHQCLDQLPEGSEKKPHFAHSPLFERLDAATSKKVSDHWAKKMNSYLSEKPTGYTKARQRDKEDKDFERFFASDAVPAKDILERMWNVGNMDQSSKQEIRLLQLFNDDAIIKKLTSNTNTGSSRTTSGNNTATVLKQMAERIKSIVTGDDPQQCLDLVDMPCQESMKAIVLAVDDKMGKGTHDNEKLIQLASHKNVYSNLSDDVQKKVNAAIAKNPKMICRETSPSCLDLNQLILNESSAHLDFIANNIGGLLKKEPDFSMTGLQAKGIVSRMGDEKNKDYQLGLLHSLVQVKGFNVSHCYALYRMQRKPLKESVMPIFIASLQQKIKQDVNIHDVSALFKMTGDIMRTQFKDFNATTKHAYVDMVSSLVTGITKSHPKKAKVLASRLLCKISKHMVVADSQNDTLKKTVRTLCSDTKLNLLKTDRHAQDLYYGACGMQFPETMSQNQQMKVLRRNIGLFASTAGLSAHPSSHANIVLLAERAPHKLRSPLHTKVSKGLSVAAKKRVIRSQLLGKKGKTDWELVKSVVGMDRGLMTYLTTEVRKKVQVRLFWGKDKPYEALDELVSAKMSSDIISSLALDLLRKAPDKHAQARLCQRLLAKDILPNLSVDAKQQILTELSQIQSGTGIQIMLSDDQHNLRDISALCEERRQNGSMGVPQTLADDVRALSKSAALVKKRPAALVSRAKSVDHTAQKLASQSDRPNKLRSKPNVKAPINPQPDPDPESDQADNTGPKH